MAGVDLSRRSTARELMDGEPVDLAALEACLRDLERINRWTRSYALTLRWLDRVVAKHGPQRLLLLDMGSGYGDMLRRIAAWGQRRGLRLDLVGIDRNPQATIAAARATPSDHPIRYLTADVFDVPDELRPDLVISALFAHHLDDAQLVRFLCWMESRARLGWLINDLHRHFLPYWIARWTPSYLRMSRLVRHDASISVARAFEERDWQRLFQTLGEPPPTVTWHFPFRYAVSRIKPS
jgi:2-polyprenyl-3-methyl-5-hydroxy-6-metoxy-1,4-benzoquinol methylase